MTNETRNLDLTPSEIGVIAAALETQSKILSVQASAGEKYARARLNEIKRTLARIKPEQTINSDRRSSRGCKVQMFLGLFFARFG